MGVRFRPQNETRQKRGDTVSTRIHAHRLPLSQRGVHEGVRLQSSDNKKVLGPGVRTSQTSAHESVHYVHGWQFHLDLSHYDGRYAHHQAGQGVVHASADVQSDRGNARVWTKVRVLLRTVSEYRVSSVQVPVDGSAADPRVRLAGVRRAPGEGGVLGRWFHVHLMRGDRQSVGIVSTRRLTMGDIVDNLAKLCVACHI